MAFREELMDPEELLRFKKMYGCPVEEYTGPTGTVKSGDVLQGVVNYRMFKVLFFRRMPVGTESGNLREGPIKVIMEDIQSNERSSHTLSHIQYLLKTGGLRKLSLDERKIWRI